MAIQVAGELYESITGQLFEIGRQLRQPSGYPFDPNQLKVALQNAIEGKFGTLYAIRHGDSRSAEQLLTAANFDKVWDYAQMFVGSKDFPISKVAEEAEFEMVEFDHDPDTDEVLAEFARRGLERPFAEDALRFGEKYPDVQLEHPIVFLHEPWRDPRGYLHVLCLNDWGGKRSLSTGTIGSRWVRACRFSGRRPRK